MVDGAGNSSPLSNSWSIVLDATVPTQTVTITGVNDDTDPIQGTVVAGGRTNDTTPTISGSVSAALGEGETLKLYNGTTFLADAVVDNTALTWSASPSISANATYTITARVVDQAGNQGPLSTSRSFILDTVAPGQSVTISGISDNLGTIQGAVADGGITNDTTPTISGSLSAVLGTSEVLTIYRNGIAAGNATVNSTNKTWTYTPATPLSANGTYAFTAAVVDGAGNSSPLSNSWSMVLDAPISTVQQDTLTGTTGADIFLLPQLSWSLLGADGDQTYDTLTGFQSTDRIQLSVRAFNAKLTTSSGVAPSLTGQDVTSILSPTWAANSARAFTVAGSAGTFVALNDSQLGYQAESDAVLFLQGYSISSINGITLV